MHWVSYEEVLGLQFDEHDLDLAERLAAQVSGPVAHAQEMILVAQKHTGEGEIQLHTLQSKMKDKCH